MTREEKIEAIYQEMANKELTPGCYVRIEPPYNGYGTFLYRLRGDETKEEIKEIIGHPVMIGDVLNWIEDKMGISNQEYEEFIIEEANMAILLWGEYLKPIEEQSDECIDYVYSLIQK